MTPTECHKEKFDATFPNLYSEGFCDGVIECFDYSVKAGFGHRHEFGTNRQDTVLFTQPMMHFRTMNFEYEEFDEIFWKKAYPQYVEKYPVIKHADSHSLYTLKVQKSEIGEGFHSWHFDSATMETSRRLLVFIVYLNDVEEGGETEFLYYPKRIKPTKGTLVLFPSGLTHTHRGNPPISNSKYIITGWAEF